MQEQRGTERDDDRQRHADDHEIERVAERLPEERVLQEPRVVPEAHQTQVRDIGERVQIEIGEAQQQGRDDKRARATWIIDNAGDLDSTAAQVEAWWRACAADR